MDKERYYIYDFLVHNSLLLIDTKEAKYRLHTYNHIGQTSFNRKREAITQDLKDKLFIFKALFSSNNFNECVKFLIEYGIENANDKEKPFLYNGYANLLLKGLRIKEEYYKIYNKD